jgi:hypothetical protein
MATLMSLTRDASTIPTGSFNPSIGAAAASGETQTARATSHTFPPEQSPEFWQWFGVASVQASSNVPPSKSTGQTIRDDIRIPPQ